MLRRRDSSGAASLEAGLLGQERSAAARHQTAGVSRSIPARFGVWILLIWLASVILSLTVEPNYDHSSYVELVYYTVYNVAIGSFVGLYLLDLVSRDGLILFALRSCAAIAGGTLVNELIVEPHIFQTGPINGEGVYYGLVEALTVTGVILFLRLAAHLRTLQRDIDAQRLAIADEGTEGTPLEAPAKEAGCFFVRVAGETRRIFAADLIYMEAERDFTRLVCCNGEHFASESLKKILEKAAPCGVVRVHKSFAVSLRRVERLTRTDACLGEWRVPVGRKYWETFSAGWKAQSPALAAHKLRPHLDQVSPS